MSFTNFKFDVDADGIALVTWDMPGRSMNVIDARVVLLPEPVGPVTRIKPSDASMSVASCFGKPSSSIVLISSGIRRQTAEIP